MRGLFVGIGLVALGCGQTHVTDVSSFDDGWKLVALVDDDGDVLDSLPAFEVVEGRTSEPLVSEVPSGAAALLLELPETSIRGHLAPERSLLESGADVRLTFTHEGRFLTESHRVAVDDPVWLIDEGAPLPVPRQRFRSFFERAILRQVVDTEPCTPPVGGFEDFVPAAPQIYEALGLDRRSVSFERVDPGTAVLFAERHAVVIRGRQLPPVLRPDDPMPRDVLFRGDFGDQARIQDALALGGGRYLLTGWLREPAGALWVVALGAEGLEVQTFIEMPIQGESVARFEGLFYMADGQGSLWRAEQPEGPWSQLRAGTSNIPTGSRLAAGPELAFVVDGQLDYPLRPELAPQLLYPAVTQIRGLEVLEWAPDGSLWLGMDAGDVARVQGSHPEWLGPLPARMSQCGVAGSELVWPHVEEQVRDIEFVGDWVFVLFKNCRGLWAFRASDGCGGVVEPFDEPLASAAEPHYTLAAAEGHLYVVSAFGWVRRAALEDR